MLLFSCGKDLIPDPDSVHVTQVAAATAYSVILKEDGTVWQSPATTGGNTFEQVATNVRFITCGSSNTFIIKNDNTLWARGWNAYGQLGAGRLSDQESSFVRVATNVKAVSTSGEFTLIIKNDNTLWAVGRNQTNQLGDGTSVNKSSFVRITDNVAEISAGSNHSLIKKTDNTIWAFGYNIDGRLANGTTTNSNIPVKIFDSGIKSIYASEQSYIIKEDNSLWETQEGTFYETRENVRKISGYGNYIITTDSILWGRGSNNYGQLGDGCLAPPNNYKPLGPKIIDVSASGTHTLIIKKDRELWAAGKNDRGQLGDGTFENSCYFIKITNTYNINQVLCRNLHSFVIIENTLWAKGYNQYGQLGTGNNTNATNFVKVMENVQKVAGNDKTTLVLKKDKTLWATGNNEYGLLGTGNTTNRNSFIMIAENVTDVSVGYVNMGYIANDNEVYITGLNTYGQLGRGLSLESTLTPLKVPSTAPYLPSQIIVGGYVVYLLTTNNSVLQAGVRYPGYAGIPSARYDTTFIRTLGSVVSFKTSSLYAESMNTFALEASGNVIGNGQNSYTTNAMLNNTSDYYFDYINITTGIKKIELNGGYSYFIDNTSKLYVSSSTGLLFIDNAVKEVSSSMRKGILYYTYNNQLYEKIGDGFSTLIELPTP